MGNWNEYIEYTATLAETCYLRYKRQNAPLSGRHNDFEIFVEVNKAD